MSFKGKAVIITGASSGIGAAAAVQFAKEAASVVMVGRNQTKLTNVVGKCSEYGVTPLVVTADVSNDEQAKSIIDKTVEAYGQIDILVNNAGMTKFGNVLTGTILAAYDEVMATNIRAIVHLTSLAAPYLVKTKGNIVNISSTGGKLVPKLAGYTPYCISKAALEHFTRCSALELAPQGVRVNVISPGPVKTDIIENSKAPLTWEMFREGTALKKIAEPEEVADLIMFLASDKAKSVTGANYLIDNGYLLKN